MDPLVELAKRAVEELILKKRGIQPPDPLTPVMSEKAGVFVCLKKEGQLRGCIGTFLPCCGNVAEETIKNAICAATEDPRFPLVAKEELPFITYSVDVLSPPEKISDPKELDPKKYGVIVVKGGMRGLLLPDLEGVETVEEQVRIAKMKAGIDPSESADIYRFEVRRYH
ncbi:MAG TPA: AmmeMemoRadiSam system protein A [Thermodesulfovibrionales bacterium]|nr:AmmeMemoRadiSam system protein A [Thermodesulfovibrionales bacterium]